MKTVESEIPLAFADKFSAGYVCTGDTITGRFKGFDIVATIHDDSDSTIDDDDTHNIDQSVTGCDADQQVKLLAARRAYFEREWSYCGIVLSVARKGVVLDNCAASLWAVEMNYPKTSAGDSDREPNDHLTDVANELLPEAIARGESVLTELKNS